MKKLLFIVSLLIISASVFSQSTSGRVLMQDTSKYHPPYTAFQIIVDSSYNPFIWKGYTHKWCPIPTAASAGAIFDNPVLPALQYNSTTTTKYWKLATGERVFTMRDDTTYHAGAAYGAISGLNQFWGRNAGNTTMAGYGDNIGIGDSSLNANTTGGDNVAIGDKSMKLNTTGYYNTALGILAMSANTTGLGNVAVGADAMQKNTTASQNASVGYFSMNANTTGAFNSALGSNAMQLNTTGGSNTSVGQNSMGANTTGSNNVAVGVNALALATTATINTAVGRSAMKSNTTGSANTAVGDSSLWSNIVGMRSVAIGAQAGYWSTEDGTFWVGNVRQANLAGDKGFGFMYGTFATAAGSNAGASLTINVAKRNFPAGANMSIGTATLSSGTVTVSNTTVTASSLIKVWLLTPGGTMAIQYAAPPASISVGTSFVINAYAANGTVLTTDTSVVGWEIIN